MTFVASYQKQRDWRLKSVSSRRGREREREREKAWQGATALFSWATVETHGGVQVVPLMTGVAKGINEIERSFPIYRTLRASPTNFWQKWNGRKYPSPRHVYLSIYVRISAARYISCFYVKQHFVVFLSCSLLFLLSVSPSCGMICWSLFFFFFQALEIILNSCAT